MNSRGQARWLSVQTLAFHLYSCNGGIKSMTTRRTPSHERGYVKGLLDRARLAFARQRLRAVLRYTFSFVGEALIRFKKEIYVEWNVNVDPTP